MTLMNSNIFDMPVSIKIQTQDQVKIKRALQRLAVAAKLVDQTGLDLIKLVPQPTGEAMLELSLEISRLVDCLADIYGLDTCSAASKQNPT